MRTCGLDFFFNLFGSASSPNGKHALRELVRVNHNKAASELHILRFDFPKTEICIVDRVLRV